MANEQTSSSGFTCKETAEELYQLMRKENVNYRFKRLQALRLLCLNKKPAEITEAVGITRGTLNNWKKWYENGGLDELLNDHIPPESQGLTQETRRNLYEVARFLRTSSKEKLELLLEVPVYVQDPSMTEALDSGNQQTIQVRWEPGLGDGPTSARFTVVDYHADTGKLIAPVRWNKERRYFEDHKARELKQVEPLNWQFHQLNVWAIVQRVLDFYEASWALGRPVPWGFEGNRLILVPHAGYGENAYYDRHSKSLQFYYYGQPNAYKFTCLSHDIITHELGHAILDGIRPFFIEASSLQTAAFHEFIADFTAILSSLRNNDVRKLLMEKTDESLQKDNFVAKLAEEFGEYVVGRDYLRSADNKQTMAKVARSTSPHNISEVLTGAMFNIFVEIYRRYYASEENTKAMALWYATQDIIGIGLQPLDYLPPVDVRFEDYAAAVLHVHQIKDPLDFADPNGIYAFMKKEFYEVRGIAEKIFEQPERRYEYIYHDIDRIFGSLTAAYYFLNDNRSSFRIPEGQDFFIADLYDNNKFASDASRRPREIILEYVWREELDLDEKRFAPLKGNPVSLLCGGTLVFDERGNIMSWCRKPGTRVLDDEEEGQRRKQELMDHLEGLINRRMIGFDDEGMGLIGPWTRPVVAHADGEGFSLEFAPHLRNEDPAQIGGESWLLDY